MAEKKVVVQYCEVCQCGTQKLRYVRFIAEKATKNGERPLLPKVYLCCKLCRKGFPKEWRFTDEKGNTLTERE